MSYCITNSDIEAIKYAISVIEADTGDCFGEDECNGKRCFKHCGDRDCCMLRAKLRLGRVLKKVENTNGATDGGQEGRNALAELSDRLYGHIVPISGCVGSRKTGLSIASDVGTAQRLIEEIAKVKSEPGGIAFRVDSAKAVMACRAIAEEGANHGNE